MKQLVVNYPDDLADAVRMRPEELEQQVRLMAALKMFELGKLSSGKAAELAGMTRAEFIEACGRFRVSVQNVADEDARAEVEADLRTLRERKDEHCERHGATDRVGESGSAGDPRGAFSGSTHSARG